MCSACAGDYENPDATAEMAVWDPHEDDHGDHGANLIVAMIIGIALSCPIWMALIAGVRWILHHAR